MPMTDRSWYRSGPSVLGYQPGWLWWAVALVVLVGGGALLVQRLQRQAINERYIQERVAHHAQAQGLDIVLVRAVVQAESSGDWLAESPAGARGLMQVMPIAHQDVMTRFEIADGDLFDPDYNLRVGTLYLRYLLDRFDEDVALAVAAYHMGPTAIERGRKKYPDLTSRQMIDRHAGPQTRAYVERVLELIAEHQGRFN